MEQYGISMDKYIERETEAIIGVMSKWSYEQRGDTTWKLLDEDGKLAAVVTVCEDYIIFLRGELSATYRFPEHLGKLDIANFTEINKAHMHENKLVSRFHANASNKLPSLPLSKKNIESGWSGEVALYELYQTMQSLIETEEWIPYRDEVANIMKSMSGFDFHRSLWEWEIRDMFSEFYKPLWEAIDREADIFGATMTEIDLFPLLAFEKLNKLIEEGK